MCSPKGIGGKKKRKVEKPKKKKRIPGKKKKKPWTRGQRVGVKGKATDVLKYSTLVSYIFHLNGNAIPSAINLQHFPLSIGVWKIG